MEEDIEGLKRLFYANLLTQYGKRKLISYYEQRYKELEEENKKLKDNYKNQIQHTTILAKALNLEEDAPIDEIYAKINNLKTNSIPTSVIQKKIDNLDKEKLKYDNDLRMYTLRNTFDFQKEILQEILEGRNT